MPGKAADIDVIVNMGHRSVYCQMRIEAPKDKKKTSSRLNWLVKQLASVEPDGIEICAIWTGRALRTQKTLSEFREAPDLIQAENLSLTPTAFEVLMTRDLAGKFSGSRTFIEGVESQVIDYFDRVCSHLKAWQAPPPKIFSAVENSEEQTLTVGQTNSEQGESDES